MPLQFAARRAGTSGVLDFVSLVGISLGELVFYGCKMPMEEVIAYALGAWPGRPPICRRAPSRPTGGLLGRQEGLSSPFSRTQGDR